jgi:signal transduction histidine kinase
VSLPEDRRLGLLSGIIGHELNNIAGALQGFGEIALHRAGDNGPVKEYLGEVRIAIGRISALAHDLESLGESESISARVPLVDCMNPAWNIDWQCGPQTPVDVDPLHAKRAVEALAQIARGKRGDSPVQLRVTDHLHAAARCVTCGMTLAQKVRTGGWALVQVQTDVRIVNREALCDPFAQSPTGRMLLRLSLSLAALVHCAHCAGGHILIEETGRLLSLAFAAPSSNGRGLE